MSTVAHEGNPRTFSIAVTGTLDGDIFLIPDGDVPTPPSPLPTEPNNPPTSGSGDCTGEVEFIQGSLNPVAVNQIGSYEQSDPLIVYGVSGENSEPCGALTYVRLPMLPSPDLYCVRYGGISGDFRIYLDEQLGTPRLGLVIQVNRESLANSLSAYALIADFTDDTVKLCTWENESANVYDTILSSDSMSNWLITDSEGRQYVSFQNFRLDTDLEDFCESSSDYSLEASSTASGTHSQSVAKASALDDTTQNIGAGFIFVGVAGSGNLVDAGIIKLEISSASSIAGFSSLGLSL